MAIKARSVSKVVLDLAAGEARSGRVLDRHARACNIGLERTACSAGDSAPVITLAARAPGNGPLCIIVDDFTRVRPHAVPGTATRLDRNGLSIGSLLIAVSGAEPWEPRPGWECLRTNRRPSGRRLDSFVHMARRHAPPNTLLDQLSPRLPARRRSATDKRLHAAFAAILNRVEATGADGLPAAAVSLAGLGNGLTPAGDDFLLGIMLAVWLHGDRAAAICCPLARIAAQRTTRLSASLLEQAAAGNCGVHWHDFLEAVASDDDVALERSMVALLAHGHTSGGDALAGFLWVCCNPEFSD